MAEKFDLLSLKKWLTNKAKLDTLLEIGGEMENLFHNHENVISGKIENGCFGEAYSVCGNYFNSLTHTRSSFHFTVLVPVKHGINEKQNHEKAQKIAINHLEGRGYNSKNIQITEVVYQ